NGDLASVLAFSAGIAQLVERELPKLEVAGSTPVARFLPKQFAHLGVRLVIPRCAFSVSTSEFARWLGSHPVSARDRSFDFRCLRLRLIPAAWRRRLRPHVQYLYYPPPMPAPVVAIIGRPNVGKSTLFNRVLGERRAVTHDRPGITRDRNAVRAEWPGRPFVLVDTGGFLPASSEGRDADVRRQAEAAIGLADAVVFLVDAHTGVTDLDQAIANQLRR